MTFGGALGRRNIRGVAARCVSGGASCVDSERSAFKRCSHALSSRCVRNRILFVE